MIHSQSLAPSNGHVLCLCLSELHSRFWILRVVSRDELLRFGSNKHSQLYFCMLFLFYFAVPTRSVAIFWILEQFGRLNNMRYLLASFKCDLWILFVLFFRRVAKLSTWWLQSRSGTKTSYHLDHLPQVWDESTTRKLLHSYWDDHLTTWEAYVNI